VVWVRRLCVVGSVPVAQGAVSLSFVRHVRTRSDWYEVRAWPSCWHVSLCNRRVPRKWAQWASEDLREVGTGCIAAHLLHVSSQRKRQTQRPKAKDRLLVLFNNTTTTAQHSTPQPPTSCETSPTNREPRCSMPATVFQARLDNAPQKQVQPRSVRLWQLEQSGRLQLRPTHSREPHAWVKSRLLFAGIIDP
jgi:hypothetical protein